MLVVTGDSFVEGMHDSQEPRPNEGLYVPSAHTVHSAPLSVPSWPASQTHCAMLSAPTAAVDVPAGQSAHGSRVSPS